MNANSNGMSQLAIARAAPRPHAGEGELRERKLARVSRDDHERKDDDPECERRRHRFHERRGHEEGDDDGGHGQYGQENIGTDTTGTDLGWLLDAFTTQWKSPTAHHQHDHDHEERDRTGPAVERDVESDLSEGHLRLEDPDQQASGERQTEGAEVADEGCGECGHDQQREAHDVESGEIDDEDRGKCCQDAAEGPVHGGDEVG